MPKSVSELLMVRSPDLPMIQSFSVPPCLRGGCCFSDDGDDGGPARSRRLPQMCGEKLQSQLHGLGVNCCAVHVSRVDAEDRL